MHARSTQQVFNVYGVAVCVTLVLLSPMSGNLCPSLAFDFQSFDVICCPGGSQPSMSAGKESQAMWMRRQLPVSYFLRSYNCTLYSMPASLEEEHVCAS